MDFTKVYYHCNVRDKEDNLVDTIEYKGRAKQLRGKIEWILRTYKVTWKEGYGKVTPNRFEKLILGTLDGDLKNDSQKWSQEEDIALLSAIDDTRTLEIPWESLSIIHHRKPETLQRRYERLVDARGRLQRRLDLSIEIPWKVCEDCNKNTLSGMVWRERVTCKVCMCLESKNIQRQELWDFVEAKSGTLCEICKRDAKEDGYHYDHKNVFDKSDSICNMIRRGDTKELLIKELEKCRVMCVRCHEIETYLENKYGLLSVKRSIPEEEYLEEKNSTEEFQQNLITILKEKVAECDGWS